MKSKNANLGKNKQNRTSIRKYTERVFTIDSIDVYISLKERYCQCMAVKTYD